jgi:hypothetical protein
MLYGIKVAVCFEINTKRINTVWAERIICKVLGTQRRQSAAGSPPRVTALHCDRVTPHTARQLRASWCKEKPSSYGYKVVCVCFRLG